MNQCEGYTKSGLRCKKKTLDISKKCHLHLKQTIQEEPKEEPKSRQEQKQELKPDQQKPRTRSETRRLLEEALLNYQRLYQHNQHNDVRENIEQLIRLETEKERIMNEMRVKEPPRRPRKPIRRNTNKKEQEKKQEKKPDLPKEDCCVCFENNVEKDEVLECKHSVCKGCVKQLRDPRCPMCRSDIKSKFITDKDIRSMKIKSRADAQNRTDESIREFLMQERFFIRQETRPRGVYIVDEF